MYVLMLHVACCMLYVVCVLDPATVHAFTIGGDGETHAITPEELKQLLKAAQMLQNTAGAGAEGEEEGEVRSPRPTKMTEKQRARVRQQQQQESEEEEER